MREPDERVAIQHRVYRDRFRACDLSQLKPWGGRIKHHTIGRCGEPPLPLANGCDPRLPDVARSGSDVQIKAGPSEFGCDSFHDPRHSGRVRRKGEGQGGRPRLVVESSRFDKRHRKRRRGRLADERLDVNTRIAPGYQAGFAAHERVCQCPESSRLTATVPGSRSRRPRWAADRRRFWSRSGRRMLRCAPPSRLRGSCSPD